MRCSPRELPYDPSLFAGLRVLSVDLPEYDEPYRILEAEPASPLRRALDEHPLIRVPVPPDLRARVPAFRDLDTQVSRSFHSQPPHQDHPHRPGDPRRFNVFWAEEARANASTYFLPLAREPEVAAFLSAALRGSAEAWEASQPKLSTYAEEPLLMSRYLVPVEAMRAYVALVRDGDAGPWSALTDFGQIITAARILGNTPVITELLPAFFAWMDARFPGELYVERWAEPCVVLSDDTCLLHGRYGRGASGAGFYRMWLADDRASPPPALAYLRAEALSI